MIKILKNNFGLIIIFAIFSLLFFYKLTQIGPEYDESLFVNAALGCPNKEMFLHLFIPLKNGCLPVMVMPYLGATQAYITRLVFSLFGVSVFSLRFTNYLVLSVSVFLIYQGILRIIGKKAAILSILFLLLDPQLFLASRYDRSLMAPFLLKSIIIFIFSIKSIKFQKYKSLAIGILAGLLFYTKTDIIFIYSCMALVAIYMVITGYNGFKIDQVNKIIKSKLSVILIFIFSFLLGLLPYIYYIFVSWKDIVTTGIFLSNTPNPTILKTLALFTQFSGQQVFQIIFGVGTVSKISLIISSIYFLIATYIIVKPTGTTRLPTFFGLTILFYYSLLVLYPALAEPGKAHHYLLIYPIPQILVSYYLIKNKSGMVTWIILSLLTSLFVISLINFNLLSEKTCGRGAWSCSIRIIANEVSKKNKTVVTGDWGIATPLLLLTKGKTNINEIAFRVDAEGVQGVKNDLGSLTKECSYFVLYSPEHSILLRGSIELRNYLQANDNYQGKTIYDRERNGLYELYYCNTIQ